MRDVSLIHCARQKAVKLLNELEQEFRLIERRRQGLGKPNLLYVKDLYAGLSQSNYWKYENHTSGSLKNELPGVPKSNGSNTEKINKTDNSETDLIYPAELQEEEQYRRYFKDALELEILEQGYPADKAVLHEILELLVETVTSRKKFLRICGEEKPKEVVKSRLMKLDSSHIQYILECLKENSTQIRNIKQYLAYKSVLPSFHLFDLLVGLVGATALKAVIYFKGKNAKKYRQGEEYGSARWGNQKDIEPFIDPVFENNVILTQTERLMMSGRPKHPKYARNKNVIVIGGSGSGKTRFYVKPNLMQMPQKVSYVVTDPKGTIIIECGKMLSDAGYKIKVLNTINFKKSMFLVTVLFLNTAKTKQELDSAVFQTAGIAQKFNCTLNRASSALGKILCKAGRGRVSDSSSELPEDMTEHEKCLTNGTYERARESGTEQNYDMIDGCVNNVPKKPRRIGGRWSVLDRLHIKQAERKQKEQPQQQQQERSRKN